MKKFLPYLLLSLACIMLAAACGQIDVSGLDEEDFDGVGSATAKFSTNVLAEFPTQGCTAASCHTGSAPAGGLQLSGTADVVHKSIMDNNVLNLADESQSTLLRVPLTGDTLAPTHAKTLTAGTTPYTTWLDWITAGALND